MIWIAWISTRFHELKVLELIWQNLFPSSCFLDCGGFEILELASFDLDGCSVAVSLLWVRIDNIDARHLFLNCYQV